MTSKLSRGWHNHLTLIGLELSSLRGRGQLKYRTNFETHLGVSLEVRTWEFPACSLRSCLVDDYRVELKVATVESKANYRGGRLLQVRSFVKANERINL